MSTTQDHNGTGNANDSFNNRLTRLETIYQTIKDLDQNNLDELMTLYQEGLTLSKALEQDINNFELKITTMQNTAMQNATIPDTSLQNTMDRDAQEPVKTEPIFSKPEGTAIFAEKDISLDENPPTEQAIASPPKLADAVQVQLKPPLSKEYIADLFSDQDD